jgi:hypothetical protein
MTQDWQDEGPWLPGAPIWDDDWDRLADRVYVGARDGNLGPEAAFDLAVFLRDWAKPDPVFDALGEASIAATNGNDIASLAREALAVVGYVPGFRIEPRLLGLLNQALEGVVKDLRATGLTGSARAVLPDDLDLPNVWLRYQGRFGHTSGISPSDVQEDGPELLVLVADELQDAVMESLFGVWPVCPQHQLGTHPKLFEGQAVWWCSARAGHVISAVGQWDK